MKTTVALLAALTFCLAAAGPAGATADPEAFVSARCVDGGVRAQLQYGGFSPLWHLTATETIAVAGVVKTKIYTFDGPSGADTLSVGLPMSSGPLNATVTTTVVGGGGRVKATGSAHIFCRQPPPPPPARFDPRAWAQGPCGDPMYRFWLDNRRSNRSVTFTVRYLDFDRGWVSLSRTVGRRTLVHTGYRHVRGVSTMTVRARGELLYSRTSAPGGNYAPCPR